MKIVFALFVLFANSWGFGSNLNQSNHEISHSVNLFHPGISKTDSIAHVLVQLVNNENNTSSFYMNVKSVVCGDQKCEVVPVKIVWDELGFYKAFELESGVELEKADGIHFSKSDYLKLDRILSNKDSDLKNADKDKIVEKQNEVHGVDAISGATSIALNENSYVNGAVWTCYTLWHWVNGKVQQIIRDITGDLTSNEQLIAYLKSEDQNYRLFALQQISRTKNYNSEVLEEVIQATCNFNSEEQKLVVEYLEQTTVDLYYLSIMKIVGRASNGSRTIFLNSLLKASKVAPPSFYEEMSRLLVEFNTYQEIDLVLRIFEQNNIESISVVGNVAKLLRKQNILIGRRAYWFLNDKKLIIDYQHQLDRFYKKNKEML